MDEAGAGIAVKNTAHFTTILLQGLDVPMPRICMVNAVERRTGSSRMITVAVDTVVIALRDGNQPYMELKARRVSIVRVPVQRAIKTPSSPPL